jgi:TP901 family phage tail tape measure protein
MATGELRFVITTDDKGSIKTVQTLDKSVDNLGKTTKQTDKTTDKFGKTLRRVMAGAGIALAIKKTIGFNKEVALVSTMMSDAAMPIDQFKGKIQDLAVAYGKSTVDMAKGAFGVISAFGEQAAQSEKLAITAKAAAAGNAETAQALALLSAVTKGYGDVSDEAFQKASDLAFETVRMGQTDFPQLAAAIGKVVPVAAAMNVKQEELFTGFATLTGVTGTAAEVTTQLSGILRAMIKPTDGMKEAIKKLGFESAEAMLEQMGLVKSMRALVGTTDGSSEAIGKLFRRAEALTAVFALTGGQAKVFDQKLIDMEKHAGATDKAFSKITDGVNKAGFQLQQTKAAMEVFVERTADAVLQSDDFNEALGDMKAVFESESFQKGIASVVGLLAKFLSNIVRLIPAFAEWLGLADRVSQQNARMADSFKTSFDTLATGLEKAGVSADQLQSHIETLANEWEFDIHEMAQRQEELNKTIEESTQIMKDSKPMDVAYLQAKMDLSSATKELNKITAERNEVMSEGIQYIIKNHKEYGITTKQVEDMRKAIRGQIITQDAATESIKKNTEAKNDNAKATEGINIVIPDTIQLNDDLSESLQGVLSEMDAANKKQEELAAGLEGEANRAIENTTGKSAGLTDELIKQQQEWENLKLGVREFVNIAAGALDAFTSIASRAGKSGEKIAQWGDILGGAVNSILRGDFLGATLSLAGNMDKLAKALMGTADSTDRLNEKIEQAKELLADIPGVSDQAAYSLGLFLDQVERGVYELDQFNEFMQDMSQVQPEDWPISNWSGPFAGIDPDELQENLDAYNQLLQDVAGTDPGAIGAAMGKALGGLNDFLAQGARGQMEFNDQVNLTLGTFANLMKSGLSITETLGMMGDSFDQLIATQQEGQFEGSKLFNELAKFRTLIKDNEDLVKSVEGFNTLLAATAELGEISQEQLSSFAREASREFEKLTAAGFSENQALQMLAPSLKALEENASRYGHTIDANTQKLIDQAREAGAFDEMADPMDTLLQIMMKIGEVLGADMSEFNNMGAAATNAGETTSKSFDDLAISISGVGDAAKTAGMDTADSFDEATASIYKVGDATAVATQEMANNFAKGTSLAKESIDLLVKSSTDKLAKMGNFPLFNANVPAVPKVPKVGFQRGTPPGDFVVPPGFPNDSFPIGLTSGEPVRVGRPGEKLGGDTFEVNLNATIVNNSSDTPATIAEKLKQAIEIDGELRRKIAGA